MGGTGGRLNVPARRPPGEAAPSDAAPSDAVQPDTLQSRAPQSGAAQSVAPDVRGLSDDEMRAWRAFLQAHARITRRLESELAACAGPSLAHYDVLVQLARADGRRLRMHELADRVLLSRSGVSRVVDRLEAEGYVTRSSCPSDARGAFAVITDAGLERLRGATPTHLDGVRRHFVDTLGREALGQLTALMERIAATR